MTPKDTFMKYLEKLEYRIDREGIDESKLGWSFTKLLNDTLEEL